MKAGRFNGHRVEPEEVIATWGETGPSCGDLEEAVGTPSLHMREGLPPGFSHT